MFVPAADEPGLGQLEHALALVVAVEPLRARLREAQRAGVLPREPEPELLELSVDRGVLTRDEQRRVRDALDACDAALQVDHFGPAEYARELEVPFTAPARAAVTERFSST